MNYCDTDTRRTIHLVEIFGAALEALLRLLALAVAEAEDDNLDVLVLRARLLRAWPEELGDPALLVDVLLAATGLLAGIDVGLDEAGLWDAPTLACAAAWAVGAIKGLAAEG